VGLPGPLPGARPPRIFKITGNLPTIMSCVGGKHFYTMGKKTAWFDSCNSWQGAAVL
jgi:hypothetical protein